MNNEIKAVCALTYKYMVLVVKPHGKNDFVERK